MEYGIQNSIEANPLFTEQVYERLLDSITMGVLRPGERVRQSELAELLGVSRQPISHALQLLKHQGLVRDAGKQGVEVTPLDPEYIVHLYRAREALEPTVAGLAAARVKEGVATPKEIDEFKELVKYGCAAAERGADLKELVKADMAFHMALYRLSGNPAIEHMMESQWPHLLRSMLSSLQDPEVPKRAWKEHVQIADCILRGDSEAAVDFIKRHAERAGKEIHSRLHKLLK
jgi:DNA-binding GntR family transcriptional regulator